MMLSDKKYKYLSIALIGSIGAIGVASFFANMIVPDAMAGKATGPKVYWSSTSVPAQTHVTFNIDCPSGMVATGGGFGGGGLPTLFPLSSEPVILGGGQGQQATSWQVTMQNDAATANTASGFVVCT